MAKNDYDPSDILSNFRILKESMLRVTISNESYKANSAAINAYANLTAVEAEVKGGAVLARDPVIERLKQDSFVGVALNESRFANALSANAFANLVKAQISLGKLTP